MTTDRAALIMDTLQADAEFAVEFDRFITAWGWESPLRVQAMWGDEQPDLLWIVADDLLIGSVEVGVFPEVTPTLFTYPLGMN